MYKYTTILTAAVVVVLASLANSVPAANSAEQYDLMSGQATAVHKGEHVRPDKKGGFGHDGHSAEGDSSPLEIGLSGLLEAISVPKRIVGSAVSSVAALLRSIDLKRLVKITLVGFAVVVLGAVAAAGAAGIAAIVTAAYTAVPYLRFFFGSHQGEASQSEMDTISEFVLDAFNKYDSHQE